MSTHTPTDSKTLIRGGSPTVFVSDLDTAVRFYTETLGLGLQYRAGEHFAMIDAGSGLTIGLHPPGRLGHEDGHDLVDDIVGDDRVAALHRIAVHRGLGDVSDLLRDAGEASGGFLGPKHRRLGFYIDGGHVFL